MQDSKLSGGLLEYVKLMLHKYKYNGVFWGGGSIDVNSYAGADYSKTE